MNRFLFWIIIFVLTSTLAFASLSISFDPDSYASSSALKITLHGPLDAKTSINISSLNGFFLPIDLDNLSNPSFDVILEADTYTVFAVAKTADNVFVASNSINLIPYIEESSPSTNSIISSPTLFNFSFVVSDFDNNPLLDAEIIVSNSSKNLSIELNNSAEGSQLFSQGSYTIYTTHNNYVSTKKEIELLNNYSFHSILLPKENISDIFTNKSSFLNKTKKEVDMFAVMVNLSEFDKNFYSSYYVPILFSVVGSSQRCQVLSRKEGVNGFVIAETILAPKSFNEVVLTNMSQGTYDIKIRCIVSSDTAVISQTRSINILDISSELKKLSQFQKDLQNVIDKINSFPSYFKKTFFNDLMSLEKALSSANEISKDLQSDYDIKSIQQKIKSLVSFSSNPLLLEVNIDSSKNIISYVDADDVGLVIKYLDLSKSKKSFLAQQENFAIKSTYEFITLTYNSGLIKKRTLVSNQIIPVQGVSLDVSYDSYFVLPSFLISRLIKTNETRIQSSGERTLIHLKEDSSALLFDSWISDDSLIKTVILADDYVSKNEITGFLSLDVVDSQGRTPLISLIILIIIAGLFFNPFYSVSDIFLNDKSKFVASVHSCIDASLSKEHEKVIQLVPLILNSHKKLDKFQKEKVKAVLSDVEKLFHKSSFHITSNKLFVKPIDSWSLEELEIEMRNFYYFYSHLSSLEKQEYLPLMNKMISHSQNILSQVKK